MAKGVEKLLGGRANGRERGRAGGAGGQADAGEPSADALLQLGQAVADVHLVKFGKHRLQIIYFFSELIETTSKAFRYRLGSLDRRHDSNDRGTQNTRNLSLSTWSHRYNAGHCRIGRPPRKRHERR